MNFLQRIKKNAGESLARNRARAILAAVLFVLGTVSLVFISGAVDGLLSGREMPGAAGLARGLIENPKQRQLFFLFDALLLSGCAYLCLCSLPGYRTALVRVTEEIEIPAPAGQKQYGSARFLSTEEAREKFHSEYVSPGDPFIGRLVEDGDAFFRTIEYGGITDAEQDGIDAAMGMPGDGDAAEEDHDGPAYMEDGDTPGEEDAAAPPPGFFKKGGLVCGSEKKNGTERWYIDTDDTHSLVVGMTGSGKSRRLVVQSVMAMALAGEGIVVTDPKGELFQYTSRTLERLGYRVDVIDFRSPHKSSRYNLLQPVIDAFNAGRREMAETYAWDLTNILGGDSSHG